MNKKKSHYFCLVLIIIFYSCKNNNKASYKSFQLDNSINFNDSVKLIKTAELKFRLDSLSSYKGSTPILSTIKQDGNEYYMFLNSSRNSVKYYNLKSPDTINTIYLDKDGSNGVGYVNRNSVIQAKNLDSIYLFNENSGILFLFNRHGKILNKIDIARYENTSLEIFPSLFSSNGFSIFNNNLYINGFKLKTIYPNTYSTIKYDIANDSISYCFKYPHQYNEVFYGAQFKHLPYITENKSTISISYPVSQYIYSYDKRENLIDSFYLGSKYFKSFIEPFSLDPNDKSKKVRDFKRENNHSSYNSDYVNFVYDNSTNLYYRFAAMRPTEEERASGNAKFKFSIIISDDKFNKIGESELFDADIYSFSNFIITRNGIAIIRKDLYQTDDNHFNYDLFSIVKK